MVDQELHADHARTVEDVREVAREHDRLAFSRLEGELASVDCGDFPLKVREDEFVGPGFEVETECTGLDDAVLRELGVPL